MITELYYLSQLPQEPCISPRHRDNATKESRPMARHHRHLLGFRNCTASLSRHQTSSRHRDVIATSSSDLQSAGGHNRQTDGHDRPTPTGTEYAAGCVPGEAVTAPQPARHGRQGCGHISTAGASTVQLDGRTGQTASRAGSLASIRRRRRRQQRRRRWRRRRLRRRMVVVVVVEVTAGGGGGGGFFSPAAAAVTDPSLSYRQFASAGPIAVLATQSMLTHFNSHLS